MNAVIQANSHLCNIMTDISTIIVVVVVLAALTHTHAKMTIQAPQQLAAYFTNKYGPDGIPYSVANYGIVPYSKTVSGAIGTPSVLEDCVFEDLAEQTNTKPILLIERNDCSFTQKSLNAQKEGAKLAVIMDNRSQDPGSVVMVDDGRGNQVTIPTILISSEDGQKILETLLVQNVVTSISFEVPTRTQSEVQLWIDISQHSNFVFLREFQPYYTKIKPHVKLQVAYPTRRCQNDYCKDSDCFYNMSYCRTDYKYWGVQSKGQLLMKEQLRQYFIFKFYPDLWWNYALQYDEICIDLAEVQTCSAKIMKKVGISQTDITKVLQESFADDDNSVLRRFSEMKYNSSIVYYPSVVVNSLVYRGNLEPFQVYELICDSLTNQPEGCSGASSSESGVGAWVGFVVVGVVAFGVFLVICFRRVARRQVATKINQQVNELVNQYITMYENERFENGTELAGRKVNKTET